MYGSLSRVMEENALCGLLGASEPYLLEYAKGNPIELVGTKKGTVKSEITEFKLFGWGQQDMTTGAQLFDKTKAEDGRHQQYNISANQLDIVPASNYWITGFTEVQPNTTYTVNIDNPVGVYYDESKQPILSGVIYNTTTFTTPPRAKHIVLTFNKDYTPFEYRNRLMLNKGLDVKPYEEYSGGFASPSEQYPQTINGVGTYVNLVIDVDGQEVETGVKLYGVQVDEYPTYVDEYGQGWLADELNLLTGTITRRINATDETKQIQILDEEVEEQIDIDILNAVVNEDKAIINNNSSAVMEIVYKAYSGG